MRARIMSNTEKVYPCVNCGGPGNIIREGADPRLKCTQCSFMYDASQSKAAEEAGLIPEGPPKLQDENVEPIPEGRDRDPRVAVQSRIEGAVLPLLPAYAFISAAGQIELCTKRDFKKTVLNWEHKNEKYKVYQLQPIKVSTKVTVE